MRKTTGWRGRPSGERATFIVRVSLDESGALHGVVERVATGLKQRFHDAREIGRIIGEIVTAEKGRRAR
jgi:hypothetical protein